MATQGVTEKFWPEQIYTNVVFSNGIGTVPSTQYLKLRQRVTLWATGQSPVNYEVRAVFDETTFQLGPDKDPFSAVVNPVQFNGGTMTVDKQVRNRMTYDIISRAVYDEEPTVAYRNVLVDWLGQYYTPQNTFPVNIIPQSQIPFSLGALALPTLVSQYVATLSYNEVTSDTIGTTEILTFFNNSGQVGEMSLAQTQDGWTLNLGSGPESFLLTESGSFIELENGTGVIAL